MTLPLSGEHVSPLAWARLPQAVEYLRAAELSTVRHRMSHRDQPIRFGKVRFAQTWQMLAASPVEEDKREAAMSDRIPVSALVALAGDDSLWVRALVACNPRTPVGTLVVLADDSHWQVRESVAANPRTPQQVLTGLFVSDEVSAVLHCVLENPSTDLELLKSQLPPLNLRHTTELTTWQRSVLQNTALPEDVLLKQLSRASGHVRLTAMLNPAMPIESICELLPTGDEDVLQALASRDDTPPSVLSKVADRTRLLRHAVLNNPSAPADLLLDVFENSHDMSELLLVVGHGNTPADVLQAATASEYEVVHFMLVGNRHIPSEALRELLVLGDPDVLACMAAREDLDSWALTELSASVDEEVWVTALGNRALPFELLDRPGFDSVLEVELLAQAAYIAGVQVKDLAVVLPFTLTLMEHPGDPYLAAVNAAVRVLGVELVS